MTNFFDMRCPECGDENEIDIAATLWVRVCSDGTDADASGDSTHTFEPDSPAHCGHCGFHGTVRAFERPADEGQPPRSAERRLLQEILERLSSGPMQDEELAGRIRALGIMPDWQADTAGGAGLRTSTSTTSWDESRRT